MHNWDVSRFPFDVQKMRIEIEDAEYDTSQVIYVADKENSKLDSANCIKNGALKILPSLMLFIRSKPLTAIQAFPEIAPILK